MKHKFKVGDKVICVGESTGEDDDDPHYGGSGWSKGKTFVISEIHSNPGRLCYFSRNDSGVWENFLQLVTSDWDE